MIASALTVASAAGRHICGQIRLAAIVGERPQNLDPIHPWDVKVENDGVVAAAFDPRLQPSRIADAFGSKPDTGGDLIDVRMDQRIVIDDQKMFFSH